MGYKVDSSPQSKEPMKIAIILGTRPEIIKLSPIIRECVARKLECFIVHSNQHYSAEMDSVFFTKLQLPEPAYNLDVHDLSQGVMVGQMLIHLEPILIKERPDWVLVQGDTNTALAGALAAAKLGIKLGHVEAGLRSYDRTMPEELNRIVADHLSDALFCPTDSAASIALGEGIPPSKIFVTGNTIVDAVQQNLPLAPALSHDPYFLLTLHRPSNVDKKEALTTIIHSLEALVDALQTPIVFPAHPRTVAALTKYSLSPNPAKIKIIEPLSYLAMLTLMQGAQLIFTDSGGIQEEACILQVPCLTLRDNTERPETIKVGANLLVGTSAAKILEGTKTMLARPRTWSQPFGIGQSSKLIISIIQKLP